MQRYSISDLRQPISTMPQPQQGSSRCSSNNSDSKIILERKANQFLKKYSELLSTLTSTKPPKHEGRRILRRDTAERKRCLRRNLRKQKQPKNYYYFKLKQLLEAAFFKRSLIMDHPNNQQQTDDLKNVLLLFTCPMCRNVLKAPITVQCGHTFCSDCLMMIDNKNSSDIGDSSSNYCLRKNHCTVCSMDLAEMQQNSDGNNNNNKKQIWCINVLVQDLVEKWRERNKCKRDSDASAPDLKDILGVEPRYHLRSGYAGLQIKSDTENKISNYFHNVSPNVPDCKKKNSILNREEFWDHSIRDIWLYENSENYVNFEQMLDNLFKDVENIEEEAVRNCWSCITINDLECILCSRCLFDPVTTSCGHTFCRGCLTRVLDHGLSCPLCMTALSVTDYARETTEVLQQAIQVLVPEHFNERVSMCLKESLIMEMSSDIPVFVCTNAFPGVACPLYVYEPRYRLLTRRCLQSSSKRFAMAGKEQPTVMVGNKFVTCGTILEIRDAVSLEDGRFILTTVGVRRYKVVSSSEQDGYDTAKVQYIKDCCVPAERLPELVQLHERVHNKASKWIRSLKPKVLAEVERLIGVMPEVEEGWYALPDGPSWTWWLMPILPLSSQLQVGFLNTTTLEKRLRAIDKMLEHMKIRMKALERNAAVYNNATTTSEDVNQMDTCSSDETERSFEMPFNNNNT